MRDADFSRIKAVHPHWTGVLRLSHTDNSVSHEGHSSKGRYVLSGRTLTVIWEKFGPDVFQQCSETYVHKDLLKNTPDIRDIYAVNFGTKTVAARKISVSVPDTNYEVSLRLNTSDVPTFQQIYVDNEYKSPNLPKNCHSIVDLGANIGLGTVFFGMKYPKARILSVEPEAGNYDMMLANTAALGDRVHKLQAAAWIKDGSINLYTESEDGLPLGEWGVQVSDKVSQSCKTTKCTTITTLLDGAGLQNVDILKVDIEGAELEIFSQGAEKWLPRVELIIVETHDRFRPGSEDAVRKAVYPLFEELPRSGENLFFRRRRS